MEVGRTAMRYHSARRQRCRGYVDSGACRHSSEKKHAGAVPDKPPSVNKTSYLPTRDTNLKELFACDEA
jgi:hypothetical protein